MFGAVIWVYGQVTISGNPGKSGSINYCNSAGCSATLPGGLWPVSFIAYSDVQISGQANLGPANPAQDFYYLLVSARDIMLNGNPQEDSAACLATACNTTTHTDIEARSGIYAAHEQIQLSGNPNIFGFMLAEDALDCSTVVGGQGRGRMSAFGGKADIATRNTC